LKVGFAALTPAWWIGLDVGWNKHGHLGLDWVSKFVDWVGLDL